MQLEQLTKALADQTRLRILLLLSSYDELCVCDLTNVLEIAQPKISRHLAILRETGLLKGRKEGQWVHYSLHPELPDWARALLNNLHHGGQQETTYLQDAERLEKEGGQWRMKCC